jgi:hypothetical protein
MSMARRVFLHVGLPKTGTTFLQTTMWHNRRRLRRQGFLYPGRKRMDHYHASMAVRGVPAGRLGEDAGAWDLLVGALADWAGDGLVSHEFFSMATGPQARAAVAALAPAEVHVVVTARDYVRQFPAVWQEALKMNSDLGFDEFMERALAHQLKGAWGWRSQDIPAVLARWGKAVDRSRIHLVTVPAPGGPRDLLWQRWCEVLGIDDTGFDRELTFANESLGAPQAALLHRVKPRLTGVLNEGPVRHRWVRGYFGHEVLVPQAGPKPVPRAHDAERLRKLAVEAVAEIERGGYAVTGDLQELVPAPEPPVGPHPDDIPDAEVVEVATRAIERMIHDVKELTEERDRLLAEARRRSVRGASSSARAVGTRLLTRVRKVRGR